MSVLSWTTEVTGFEGIIPKMIYINTNDTFATITTAGYLNTSVEAGLSLDNGDMALVKSSTGPLWLEVVISGGNYSLQSPANSSTVVLPTIANHIATYTNTIGTLSEDPATAISAGNIQAGLSGTAGALISYPATPLRGNLQLVSANSAGNTATIITNASQAAGRTFTIPDPGASSSNISVTTGATVANNFVMASGVSGQIVDSGVAVAGLQLNASGTISAANFQGMYATPVQLIPTPGAGFGILVFSAYVEIVFATAAPANGGAIIFQYGNTVHGAGVNTIANGGTLTIAAAFATGAAANQWTTLVNGINIATTLSATTTNLGVFLSNDTGAFTANGGTSSIRYAVNYMIVPMV